MKHLQQGEVGVGGDLRLQPRAQPVYLVAVPLRVRGREVDAVFRKGLDVVVRYRGGNG